MNAAKLAHPGLEQLTAFAQGRLGEAELSEIHAHLSDCAECRNKVEASGDDTLVSLLRAADTNTKSHEKKNLAEPVTVAVTAQAPATPDLPAELAQHGRYRVQELLGVGGMGAVYKAEHLLMERPVALKLISHSLTSNPAMIERFRREVKTAGQLRHANIVMAYDAEQAGESHFLVMEYVEGKSLARVVADQGPLPVREACDYVRQAAVGLQYAHERGMVHRDIKPQNLMLTPEGQVKILDFGLARFAMEAAPAGSLLAGPQAAEAPASASLTQIGIVMGTPDYIAPEQARDAHTADIRADIYSLGCTLYNLLAGHAPFSEGTLMTKVIAHIERMPRPLTELRSDVPPALARVVERMMAKDPAQRYQTPAEAATALAPFAAPESGRARSRPRTRVGPAAAASIAIGLLAAGIIIFWQTHNGVVRFEISDPEVKVVIDQEGPTITGADKQPIKVKAGTHGLTIRRGDFVFDTTSFQLKRGTETTLKIDWHDGFKMVVLQDGREIGSASAKRDTPPGNVAKNTLDREARRNPFGVSDVDDPDGAEVQAFAVKTKLAGGADDPNAEQWVTRATKGDKGSLDGEWYGRWRRPHLKEPWVYCEGTVQIKTAGERVYILYKDHTDTFLVEARRENGRLVGRVQGTKVRNDNGPCVFVIVGPDRLDGEFDDASGGRGRQDFRRKLEQVDRQAILGTWKAVSASMQGQQMPELILKAISPSVTFADGKVTWKANPAPEAKDLFGDALAKFSLDGVFHLDPAKSPRTIDLTVLGAGAKTPLGTPAPRALLGIYKLDGDTLEICSAIDPDHPEERPTKFESVPGKFIAHLILKREAANTPPAKGRLINTFGAGFQPITRDGVTEDQGAWRIDARDRVVRLYEVQPPLEDCLVTYRARIKSLDLKGKAYLEMYCRFSWGGEFFSRGLMNAISGTRDWVTVEIPFFLQKEERPDLLKLNLHVEGAGTVWIKDIELWQAPLPPEMRRPSSLKPAVGFTPGVVKSFNQTDKPISDRVQPDQKGWRITGKGGTIRLFEVKDFKDDVCMATYRAQLKSSALKGQAYLEMLVHLPGDPDDAESFSRGLAMPLTGTSDWASYETPFRLEKGQRPDRVRLNLVIQGEGSVWIRDIELLRGPLAK